MLSPHYVVGLTDGEGSFSVFIHQPIKARAKETRYYRIECHYYIKLREDELPLLREVQKFFSCGGLYLQKEKRKNHRQCYRFEVSSYEKIEKVIIPFFKRYPLHSVNRKNDFRLFCQIFSQVKNRKGKHLNENEIEEIRRLKGEMHK